MPADRHESEGPTPSDAYYDELYHELEVGATDGPAPRSDETAEAALPDAIGRYKILGVLGEGGQGVTYRAFHPALQREVVLKTGLDAHGVSNETFKTIRDEARLLASVEHANTARVYDMDVADRKPFVVLELIRGRSVQLARQDGPWSPDRVAETVAAVARACEAAHRVGVIHRDIKPANIVLDEERGLVKLIDFGIARLRDAWSEGDDAVGRRDGDDSDRGAVWGTAEYMAPEQARGETEFVGPRSDVFALGGVLFFLLTGRPPFTGATIVDVLDAARSGEFPRELLDEKTCPRRLQSICFQALEPEIDARQESAGELAESLEQFAAAYRRRRSTRVIASALVVAAVVAIAGIMSGVLRGSPPSFEQSVFELSVDRGELGVLPVTQAVPLRSGDGVIVEIETPASAADHTIVFWIDSEGRAHELEPRDTAPARDGFARAAVATTLAGSTGTEAIFACGNRDRPTLREVEELAARWLKPWPPMASQTCIRVDREGVRLVGLRAPSGARAPPDSAFANARGMRRRLLEHFEWVAGWIFPHDDPAIR